MGFFWWGINGRKLEKSDQNGLRLQLLVRFKLFTKLVLWINFNSIPEIFFFDFLFCKISLQKCFENFGACWSPKNTSNLQIQFELRIFLGEKILPQNFRVLILFLQIMFPDLSLLPHLNSKDPNEPSSD